MNNFFVLFGRYGVLALLFMVMLEYACFPIPSEVILPFLGYISKINDYSLIVTVTISVIFSYLGCLIMYVIGYYGGERLYKLIYSKIKRWQKGLDKCEIIFKKHDKTSSLICRVIPLCRTYISFFCGLFKQDLFSYSLFSLIGIIVWNTVLIISGYFLANKWAYVQDYYSNYKKIVLLFIGIIFLFVFAYKMYRKVNKRKNINGD